MANELRIDRAGPADAPVIAGFVARLLAELFGGTRNLVVMEATARELLAVPDIFAAYIALRDDVPVGVLTLATCVSVYAGGRFGEIAELCVDPDHRSAGIGEALIGAAAVHGRERGWSRLEVGAPPADRWQRTVAFYLRNGFAEIGPRLGLSLTPTSNP
jgi:GNAT superfamily N-acetyltransferase